MKWIAKYLLAVVFVFAAMGCASTMRQTAAPASGQFREQNEGYSSLYKLASDESDVSKILILKHANEPVAAVIREISAFMQSTKKQMDEFAKGDPRIRYNVPDLPQIELRSRELQAKDERNALLFSGGEKFQLRLIFTQIEAINYAMQLSKSLAEVENDVGRKSFLNDVAKRCGEFHERLINLLSVKS